MTNFKFNRIVKKLAVLLIALSSFLSASLTSFAASDVDTGLYPHTSLAAAATEARKNVIARVNTTRTEERRVGKACRSRWSPYH